jgi:hypothetical protein
MVIFKKVVAGLLFGAFIASVAYLCYLHVYFAYYMPRNPDPTTGRVFLVTVNHGYHVYVTQRERACLNCAENEMMFGGGVAFLIACIILNQSRVNKKAIQKLKH